MLFEQNAYPCAITYVINFELSNSCYYYYFFYCIMTIVLCDRVLIRSARTII